MVNSTKSAVPGEFLGVSEEFAAGQGTMEDSDGRIFSIVLGEKHADNTSRSVSVVPVKAIKPLCAGDLVYARVDDLYESMALMRFEPVGEGRIHPSGNGAAFMRISELDDSYVERLQDFIRIGDLVKARVVEVKPLGIYLSIKENGLGVVSACCTRDRSMMIFESTHFRCPVCGGQEGRKLTNTISGGRGGRGRPMNRGGFNRSQNRGERR